MKKLIAFIVLISSMQIMFAEEVSFINKCNEDVFINLRWKSSNKSDQVILVGNQIITKNSLDFDEFMFSAPSRHYKLLNIKAITSKDLSNNGLKALGSIGGGAATGTLIGYKLGSLIDSQSRGRESSEVPFSSMVGLIVGAYTGFIPAVILMTYPSTFEADGNSFFVIDKVNGKIDIKGYPSQKDYEDEVAKTQN